MGLVGVIVGWSCVGGLLVVNILNPVWFRFPAWSTVYSCVIEYPVVDVITVDFISDVVLVWIVVCKEIDVETLVVESVEVDQVVEVITIVVDSVVDIVV